MVPALRHPLGANFVCKPLHRALCSLAGRLGGIGVRAWHSALEGAHPVTLAAPLPLDTFFAGAGWFRVLPPISLVPQDFLKLTKSNPQSLLCSLGNREIEEREKILLNEMTRPGHTGTTFLNPAHGT